MRWKWKWLRQAVCQFSELGKFGGHFRVELSGCQTPLPVSAVHAGCVHTSFACQPKHVLHGYEREIGDRVQRPPDKRPLNPIFATSQIGFRIATFMLGGAGLEPADGCIVVVRSGIDDLARGAMRQIHVRTLVAEAEL